MHVTLLGYDAPEHRHFEADKILITQSFSHYQHLENSRLKYIIWMYSFFLATLGVVALFAREVELTQLSSALIPRFLTILSCSALLVNFIFGFFIYLQVVATQAAISAYDTVIGRIMGDIYGSPEDAKLAFDLPFQSTRVAILKESPITQIVVNDRTKDLTPIISKFLVSLPTMLIGFAIPVAFFHLEMGLLLNLISLVPVIFGIWLMVDTLVAPATDIASGIKKILRSKGSGKSD